MGKEAEIQAKDVKGQSSESSPLIGKRVTIFNLAKEYREKGVPKEQEKASTFSFKSITNYLGITEEYDFQSPEALKKWYSMKPKLYALTAVMTDRIIGHALEAKDNYPPFGLIQPDQGATNIETKPTAIDSISNIATSDGLGKAMRASLKRARDEVIATLKDRKGTPEIYDELKSLIDFKIKYVKPTTFIINGEPVCGLDADRETELFLQSGINTAVKVMSQLVGVLPKIYEREGLDLDPKDMKQTAKNSLRLIMELADIHSYEFAAIYLNPDPENDEHFEPFNPERLTLVDGELGKRLKIIDNLPKHDRNAAAAKVHPIKYIGPDIVGCPARANFGDGSVIRRLWDWHVELAPEIYAEQRRQKESTHSN